jgi:glycosyltransferase involved in cell wall biosynthesis
MTRKGGPKRILLLVNADRNDIERHSPKGKLGPRRRTDFAELESALDAEVLDWSAVRASRLGRAIERTTNWYVAAAVLAFLRRREFDLVWCMSEQEGSLLALLFKATRTSTALMMVSVVPTSRSMWLMLRVLRVHTHITQLFLTSTFVLDTLRSCWGVPPERLSLLPYQVDVDFFSERWTTVEAPETPYILGVGRESRDYETLIAAVRGLPVDLVIAADSHWAARHADKWRYDLPPNVTVTSEDYPGLRDLYAGCAFVVVPLCETDVQNGITAIQEAMAMSKAVVVSRTRGQGDLVADDQVIQRNGTGRSTTGYFAYYFAPNEHDLHGPTGIYVEPGNVASMRTAIERLLDDPKLADDLGARGRAVCEAVVSLDLFIERVLEATKEYR